MSNNAISPSIDTSLEGWTMVLISSISCVLGASMVVILGGQKRIITSKKFLACSMALGGGVLIFNSLYTLLPASQQKLNSNFYTFVCFFAGVIFTVLLTITIQCCTPYAIHTCDPISTVHHHSKDNEEEETTAIFNSNGLEENMEYGSILITSENVNPNVVTAEKNDYLLIGMQTAIAICIHKFPEGLIMFISNKSSSQLGFAVAVAMTIHNFIEGFLIALPLYYATGNRFASFAYASFLGGMSQPLGAVLGLLAVRNVDKQKEQHLFGITFGVVSGMMCLIAIQSMIPQAVRADTSNKCVPTFFFIGIFLVGISSLLQSI